MCQPDAKRVHGCGHGPGSEHRRRSRRREHSEEQDQNGDAGKGTNGRRLRRPTIEQSETKGVWDHERDGDVYLRVVACAAEADETRGGRGQGHTQEFDQRPIGPFGSCVRFGLFGQL